MDEKRPDGQQIPLEYINIRIGVAHLSSTKQYDIRVILSLVRGHYMITMTHYDVLLLLFTILI